MNYKKILSILSIFFLITLIPTYAIEETKELEKSNSLFGINFSKIWNYLAFWKSDKPEQKEEKEPQTNKTQTNEPKQETKQPTSTQSNQNNNNVNNNNKQETKQQIAKPVIPSKPPEETLATINGQAYTKSQIASSLNTNEQFQGYIKGFNYECMAIETDKGAKLTLSFNTESGKVTNVIKTIDCDKEIYIEESLIADMKKDKFQGSKIKSYLERVELPMSMYFKAIKVFTIG